MTNLSHQISTISVAIGSEAKRDQLTKGIRQTLGEVDEEQRLKASNDLAQHIDDTSKTLQEIEEARKEIQHTRNMLA